MGLISGLKADQFISNMLKLFVAQSDRQNYLSHRQRERLTTWEMPGEELKRVSHELREAVRKKGKEHLGKRSDATC